MEVLGMKGDLIRLFLKRAFVQINSHRKISVWFLYLKVSRILSSKNLFMLHQNNAPCPASKSAQTLSAKTVFASIGTTTNRQVVQTSIHLTIGYEAL